MSMKLYIESVSKNEKYIYVESKAQSPPAGEAGQKSKGAFEYKVKEDLLEELKNILKEKDLKLEDFEDFVAVPTESFTGYRQAVNVCNILKHYVKSVPIEKLEFPKYHKEPNISKPKSGRW